MFIVSVKFIWLAAIVALIWWKLGTLAGCIAITGLLYVLV